MASLVQLCNMALARLGAHQSISSLTEQSNIAAQCRNFLDQARRAALAEFDWPFAKVLIPLAQTLNVPPPPWCYEYVRPACIRVRGVAIISPIVAPGADTILSGTASSIDFGGPIWPQGGPAFQGLSQPGIGMDPSPTVIPFTTGAVQTSTTQLVQVAPPPPPPPMGSGSSTVPQGSAVYASYLVPGGVQQVIWTNAANAAAWCTVDVTDPNGWEPGFLNVLSWFLAAEIAVNVTGSAQVQTAMMQGAQAALGKASSAEGNEETQIASWNADWMDARSGLGGAGWGAGVYGGGYSGGY